MSAVTQDVPAVAMDNRRIPEGIPVTITVNAQPREVIVAPDARLVDFIRDTLGLTGTKVGCETGQCGTCLVLLDGVSVKSCAVLAAQADGRAVTTVEGLASGDEMTPLQECFRETHSVQCGFCTPGMLISMTDLLQQNPDPSEAEIREWLDGTMCRCAVHQHVVQAVRRVAEQARQQRGE